MNPSYLAIQRWSKINSRIWRCDRLKISIKQKTAAETVKKYQVNYTRKQKGDHIMVWKYNISWCVHQHTLLREVLNVQNSCCSRQLRPTYSGIDPNTGDAILCKSPGYIVVPGPWYITGCLKSVLNNRKTMYLNARGQLLRQTGIMVVPHLCNSDHTGNAQHYLVLSQGE